MRAPSELEKQALDEATTARLMARANLVTPLIESGRVFLPDGPFAASTFAVVTSAWARLSSIVL
jgi:hypothetical protein